MLFQNAAAVIFLTVIPLVIVLAACLILSLVKMNKIKKQYGMEEIRRNEAIYRAYADRRDGTAVWTVALTAILLGAALAFALLFSLGDGGALLFLGLLFALLIAVPAFFAASLWIFLLSAKDAKRLPFEECRKRYKTAKTRLIVSAVLLGLDAVFCIGFPILLLVFIPLTVFSALCLILSLVKMNKIKKQYGMEEIRRNEAIYCAYADKRDGAAVWTVALTAILLGAALAFALLFGLGDGGALVFLGLLFALLIAVPAFFAASLWIYILSAKDAKRLPFEVCRKRSRTAKTVFIVSAVLLGLDAAFCIGFSILFAIALASM